MNQISVDEWAKERVKKEISTKMRMCLLSREFLLGLKGYLDWHSI